MTTAQTHSPYLLGIDIGGTSTRVAIAASPGAEIHRRSFSTPDDITPAALADRIATTARSLMERYGVSIAAGGAHSLAVGTDGGVRAWGNNGSARLGDNTTTTRLTPVATQVLTSGVARVFAGWDHSLAVKSDGTAWGWGENGHRQLADVGLHPIPYPIAGPTGPGRLDDGYVVWRGARGGVTRIPVAITR